MSTRSKAAALAGALLIAATSDRGRVRIQPPRGAADQPGPGRRQHRPVRVRQPRRPDTVTIIANYIPLEEPAGGPNFNTFGDDVLYEINIDNNGDAQGRHHLPVPASRPARSATRQHLPVQHRPDHLAERPELEHAADLQRHARRAAIDELGDEPADPAGEHRPALDAELRGARPRRQSRRSPTAIKVFAGQRDDAVLRRPRLDLRPGRPAPVQRAPRHPARHRAPAWTASAGYNTHTIAHPGADQPLTRTTPDGPTIRRRDRHLGQRQPQTDAVLTTTARSSNSGTGCRSRAWASR